MQPPRTCTTYQEREERFFPNTKETNLTHYTFTDFENDATLETNEDFFDCEVQNHEDFFDEDKDLDEDLLNGEQDLVAFFQKF